MGGKGGRYEIKIGHQGMLYFIIFQNQGGICPPLGTYVAIQIPTRIPEKIVVGLFSGLLVNSGILQGYSKSMQLFIVKPLL